MTHQSIEKALNLVTRRGFIVPAFSIYGELAGFYDYGPLGVKIKQRLTNQWRRFFIEQMGNLEIETTIIAPEKVFEASGHLKTFTDPVITCLKCSSSFRADKLLEEYYEKKGNSAMKEKVKQLSFEELGKLIADAGLKCEKCGQPLAESKIEKFNLMLGTDIGPLNSIKGYLRPETAQGIFIDFKSIFRIYGLKLPVAIGQVGKAFRNEISPRNLLIRMREFSQMELEYFFDPEEDTLVINNRPIRDAFLDSQINLLSVEDQTSNSAIPYADVTIRQALERKIIPNKLFAFVIHQENEFMQSLGFKKDSFRFRQMLSNELPHYSKGNIDLEVKIGDSFEEVAGNSYRTNFDLSNHQTFSGTDLSVMNNLKKVLPHVVEISFGLDRLFWSTIVNAVSNDGKREWDLLLLDKSIAPYDFAVFPLQKDDKLLEKAREVFSLLSKTKSVYFSISNSIGKRYAKADEIGINSSITVDFQTLDDGTVTVRDIRDASQVRKSISELLK